MDPRMQRAQELFWEIDQLKERGASTTAAAKLTEMAQLHRERALDLLKAGDADGWIDLYAAITAWGDSRQWANAHQCLSEAFTWSAGWPAGRENIERELRNLKHWLGEGERAADGSAAPTLPPIVHGPLNSTTPSH